ncbi:membrane protein [Serratia phage 92A1]|nr:membrane protein [Serratia phage 92A1]
MIINKNSFSYRWMKFFDMSIPNSLCPYMRKFFFSLVAAIGITGIIIFLFLGAGMGILGLGALSTLSWISIFKAIGTGAVVICSSVAALVGVGASIVIGIDKYEDHKQEKKAEYKEKVRSGEIVPKAPSQIRTYITAFHKKICPTLEFK